MRKIVNAFSTSAQIHGAPSEVLSRLLRLDAYQALRKDLFPSIGSLQWQVRQFRSTLEAERAIFIIAGKTLLDPIAFDRVILEKSLSRDGKVTQSVTQKSDGPEGPS